MAEAFQRRLLPLSSRTSLSAPLPSRSGSPCLLCLNSPSPPSPSAYLLSPPFPFPVHFCLLTPPSRRVALLAKCRVSFFLFKSFGFLCLMPCRVLFCLSRSKQKQHSAVRRPDADGSTCRKQPSLGVVNRTPFQETATSDTLGPPPKVDKETQKGSVYRVDKIRGRGRQRKLTHKLDLVEFLFALFSWTFTTTTWKHVKAIDALNLTRIFV